MAAKKESQFSPSSVAIPPHRFRCRDAFSTLCRLWSQSGLSFSLIFSLLLWPNNRPQISLIGFWKTRNHFYFHLTGSSRQLRLLHIFFPFPNLNSISNSLVLLGSYVRDSRWELPQNHHLTNLAVVAGFDLVEIDAAGDRFTVLISSVPMDGLLPTLIATRPLLPQIHLSY